MDKKEYPPDNEYQIRCPKLGHQIAFSYCRLENRGLPCAKVLDCWYDHFLVEMFLRKTLSAQQWECTFNTPPKSKLSSLLEIMEQAKTNNRRKDSDE